MAQKTTTRLPTIGTVIRAWRLFCGMSSTELAEKAGVRIAYLSEIENERTINPKEKFLEKLADALEVPLEDILGRRMPPKKKGDGQTVKSKQQVIPTPMPINPAIAIPRLPFDSPGAQINRLIASRGFSEEQEEGRRYGRRDGRANTGAD